MGNRNDSFGKNFLAVAFTTAAAAVILICGLLTGYIPIGK